MSTLPRLSFVSVLLAALAAPASADGLDQTRWRCWYHRDQQVACTLQEAPPSASLSAAQRLVLERQPGFTRNGVLPPAVTWIRERPGAMRGRTILIPLHGEPVDHAFVAELAQAVMCGPQPRCLAYYDENPPSGLPDLAAFADANDPLLEPGE